MADPKNESEQHPEFEVERAFGSDLSDVEVVAAQSTDELGAQAMTEGDAAFAGQDDPSLAAEEVAHAATRDGGGAGTAAAASAAAANASAASANASAAINATAANSAASAQMAQPSSTVSNGQYQQAVQGDEEAVAADTVAVQQEAEREYEVSRAEEEAEQEALEAKREEEVAREQQEAREAQEQREREEREREEREQEEQEAREREEREREEAEADHSDSDGYDYY